MENGGALMGPVWDHTLCAMVNDVRVGERRERAAAGSNRGRPVEMRYRYFLGVKWSQVQILSARHRKMGPELGRSGATYDDRGGPSKPRATMGSGDCFDALAATQGAIAPPTSYGLRVRFREA
jgi:hypothetical protein